jgi:hypothetical protein
MDINELTYQIRGAVFEVNRILGAGFFEKVYQRALLIELWKRGLLRLRLRGWFLICPKGTIINVPTSRRHISLRQSAWVCG